MRVLFFMDHPGFVRNFENALAELVGRGHRVELAFDSTREAQRPLLDRLSEGISWSMAPPRSRDGWTQLARLIRLSLDYLRYLEPEYAGAPKLRSRAARLAPPGFATLVSMPLLRTARARAAFGRGLTACEEAVPTDPAADRFVAEAAPDVVLVTPLVGFGSHQTRYLRSAHGLGIPTALAVASWDNLTNKGLVHEPADLTLVWNEGQGREAVELHGLPREQVIVTGAHSYDHWFGWRPSTSREEFCRKVGLDPAQPFLLYVCSSEFVAPDEVAFVPRWLRRLRETGGRMGEVGVLVRPHPLNAARWDAVEEGDRRTRVWPPEGSDPVTDEAKAEYYDSIHHAAAVVGVNTSALIESAIVGRPVFAVRTQQFRESQDGMLHFAHLTDGPGPLVTVGESFAEHAAQLEAALDGTGSGSRERNQAFLRWFVRPQGLDRRSAPLFADAVERLSRQSFPPPSQNGSGALRRALAPVALAVRALEAAHAGGRQTASEAARASFR